ncbi:MAG TPA: PHP domain-containing protein [Nevskiaceae bacterium]
MIRRTVRGTDLGSSLPPAIVPAASSDIDLHCHSLASDGTLAPGDVIAAAAAAGVRTLALTDHDTLAGLPSAAAAASRRGIRLISGVELSCRWEQRTVHVVGLGFDGGNEALQRGLAELQATRRARATRIAQKLEALGVADALERVQREATDGQITRQHFARLLIEDGLCRDTQRAFKRFLGRTGRAYVAAAWAPLPEVVAWIHGAGGCAALAHPFAYRLSASALGRLIGAFRDADGDALEVCCGTSRPANVAHAAELARRHGLLGSVGSDFHDPAQPWRQLGRLTPLPPSITPVWTRFGIPRDPR